MYNPEEMMPATYKQSEEAASEASEWLSTVDGVTISTADEYEFAAKCLAEVKTKYKELESQRQEATKPLLESKRVVDSWYKPSLTSLAKVESQLKAAISKYQLAARKAAQEELEKAAKAKTTEKALESYIKAEEVKAPKVQGVSSREIWRFELEDVSKLPREYLVPDMKKIGAVVRTLGKDAKIPGVKTWSDLLVSVRSGQ